jgi:heme A synthase
MSGMPAYYISRAVISAACGLLLALTGLQWWMATLMGVVVFGLFLWAPRSGRYAVHPESGVTALRRDERTQAINDKAARNAFIVTMLAMAGIAIYYGSIAPAGVPVAMLQSMLILGALTYFVSDFFLRRS